MTEFRQWLIRLIAGDMPVLLNCFVRGGVNVENPAALVWGNRVDGRKPMEKQFAVTMGADK